MKKPRENKTEVDLTTLLDPAQLMSDVPEGDCFGVEWDPQCADCAICHDVEICGIVKQSDTQKKVKKLEKEKGPFLDQSAFEKIDFEGMAKAMKNYADEGDPYTFDELAADIGTAAKTKDQVAIREYIKTQLPRYSLTIVPSANGDKKIIPYESTDHHIQQKPLTREDSIPGSGV